MNARASVDTAVPRHVVQIYRSDAELDDAVGEYLANGLGHGDGAVVIARPEHITGFASALTRAGVDVQAARRGGALIELDAAVTLATFMVDGVPDPVAFDAVMGERVRAIAAEGRAACAYGEMVAILWEEGNVTGALRLEELWNELLARVGFSLFCAYPASIVGDDATGIEEICRLHSDVIGGNGRAPRATSKAFGFDKDAPRAARRFATETLTAWGRDDLVQDVTLVLTELATNALIHAGSAFDVELTPDGSTVRLSVYDRSTSPPAKRALVPGDVGGRGLSVVEGVSARWGSDATAGGKVVWAEF